MEICLICNEEVDVELLDHGICSKCQQKKIKDNYDYVANKKERKIIKQLIKIEDLLS